MLWELRKESNQDKNWVLKAGGRHGHLSWGQGMGTLREKAVLHVPGARDGHGVGRQQRFQGPMLELSLSDRKEQISAFQGNQSSKLGEQIVGKPLRDL